MSFGRAICTPIFAVFTALFLVGGLLKTSQAVFDLVAANAARYSELDYNQIVLLRKHEEGEGLIEFAKGEIEKLDKKAERLRQEARDEAKEKAAFEQAEALRRAQVEQTSRPSYSGRSSPRSRRRTPRRSRS